MPASAEIFWKFWLSPLMIYMSHCTRKSLNTGSWPKTEVIMGPNIKTKCKLAHIDAYSGGQALGKKDVRVSLEKRAIRGVNFQLFIVQPLVQKTTTLQHKLLLLTFQSRTVLQSAISPPMLLLLLLALIYLQPVMPLLCPTSF